MNKIIRIYNTQKLKNRKYINKQTNFKKLSLNYNVLKN